MNAKEERFPHSAPLAGPLHNQALGEQLRAAADQTRPEFSAELHASLMRRIRNAECVSDQRAGDGLAVPLSRVKTKPSATIRTGLACTLASSLLLLLTLATLQVRAPGPSVPVAGKTLSPSRPFPNSTAIRSQPASRAAHIAIPANRQTQTAPHRGLTLGDSLALAFSLAQTDPADLLARHFTAGFRSGNEFATSQRTGDSGNADRVSPGAKEANPKGKTATLEGERLVDLGTARPDTPRKFTTPSVSEGPGVKALQSERSGNPEIQRPKLSIRATSASENLPALAQLVISY